MEHQGTKPLESERLILRRFTQEDAEFMYENWANDPEVTKHCMWQTHQNVQVSEGIITEWINNYEKNDYYTWAIVPKENNNAPIGSIGTVRINEAANSVHIGYCIGRKWWNKGITSEAFRTIIPFLFNEVKVNRIDSRHDPRNPNSGKVMVKCGLKYEGTLKQSDWNNQGICDSDWYALLASEFYSNVK